MLPIVQFSVWILVHIKFSHPFWTSFPQNQISFSFSKMKRWKTKANHFFFFFCYIQIIVSKRSVTVHNGVILSLQLYFWSMSHHDMTRVTNTFDTPFASLRIQIKIIHRCKLFLERGQYFCIRWAQWPLLVRLLHQSKCLLCHYIIKIQKKSFKMIQFKKYLLVLVQHNKKWLLKYFAFFKIYFFDWLILSRWS